jgi:cobyrinic acid a,c-diamide synthase
MTELGPRLVIAGTHSGVGKTTVATGLMAALRARGHRVGAAKVGPDYIDPTYHALATGKPSRNLDTWMCGREATAQIAQRAARGSDLLVVEGVMGLFDGGADPTEPGTGSTADVAKLLDAPVVLVIDASAMSGSVAAIAHGFATLDPAVDLVGVILNRVASDSHDELLREALAPIGIPVLGSVRRDDRMRWRDRHLGLVPVAEDPTRVAGALAVLAAVIDDRCDLDRIVHLAHGAPRHAVPGEDTPTPPAVRARIAVAAGPAFTFTYPDNLEALAEAGAELLPFDPLTDPTLPSHIDGLVLGGGFPEVFAVDLAENRSLLADLRTTVDGGTPTWAECGGLLMLSRSLDGHAMAGAIDADATMTERLTLGYRRAHITVPNPLAGPGVELRGHEYHYSQLTPAGGAIELTGRRGTHTAGFASPTLLASYLHLHVASHPGLAPAFVDVCARRAALGGAPGGGAAMARWRG